MNENSTVLKYMTDDVVSLRKNDTIEDFIEKLEKTGHSGYPVCDKDGKLDGYITSKNILLSDKSKISDIEYENRPRVRKEYSINRVSNIMFRDGYHELPVVDDDNQLLGIISNLDVIRSNIDRSDIQKLNKIMSTYEEIYDIDCYYETQEVKISNLIPTQSKVRLSNVKARQYEIKNNIIEPVIVAETKNQYVLLDGHHRLIASIKSEIEYIDAYLIKMDVDKIDITEMYDCINKPEDIDIVEN